MISSLGFYEYQEEVYEADVVVQDTSFFEGISVH